MRGAIPRAAVRGFAAKAEVGPVIDDPRSARQPIDMDSQTYTIAFYLDLRQHGLRSKPIRFPY